MEPPGALRIPAPKGGGSVARAWREATDAGRAPGVRGRNLRLGPLLLSLLDCKDINLIFLTTIAVSMTGMGISFYFPSLGLPLVIPCLAVAGVV